MSDHKSKAFEHCSYPGRPAGDEDPVHQPEADLQQSGGVGGGPRGVPLPAGATTSGTQEEVLQKRTNAQQGPTPQPNHRPAAGPGMHCVVLYFIVLPFDTLMFPL